MVAGELAGTISMNSGQSVQSASRLLNPDFGSTLARLGLESLLSKYSTTAFTLEIGARNSRYSKWFPNRVALDIRVQPELNVRADAHHLPFRNNVFEVILSTEVLQCFHTPFQVFQEMFRVMKPNGLLLLTAPFAPPIYDAPEDYCRFTRFGLANLLREWKVESIQETTTDGACLVNLMHYWLFAHKGLLWKIPKIFWFLYWSIIKNSYKNGTAKLNQKSIMPAGYFLVARRPD
jgi:SAM-dependent methyltransferase